MHALNIEEFIKVVQSRRSVRVFEKTNIPEDVINSCLDLALLAPNSSNLQPWGFYWVRTQEKKDAIVEACLSQPAAKTAAELIVCVARIGTWKENSHKMIEILEKYPQAPKQALDYYKRLVPLVYTQGIFGLFGLLKKIILFIRGFKFVTVREPTSKSEMITWATKSASLACENLMLALRAYSYDSCPMEGFDSCRIKKILNLPKDAYITMVIGAGKRAPNGVYGPQIRFDRKNFITEV
ncbi:MAG: nitroreductase family protein [Bdellovibrionota bacterium]